MAKINTSNSLKMKKVTLGSMKVLVAHGFNKMDNALLGQAVLDVCSDEKKLREICEAIFEDDFSNVDLTTIDLEDVAAGIKSFLQKLLNPTRA